MRELGNEWNRPYKKSARVVGDVIGKVPPARRRRGLRHDRPHGAAVSMRYLLVDGQGNFGSVDGDAPAPCATPKCACPASRRSSGRPSTRNRRLRAELRRERARADRIPTRIPNLLVNGSSGIAVGMATNIPPHNLGRSRRVPRAARGPGAHDCRSDQARAGPDFPTAGMIYGIQGVVEAYNTVVAASMYAVARTSRRSTIAAAKRSSSPSCPIR